MLLTADCWPPTTCLLLPTACCTTDRLLLHPCCAADAAGPPIIAASAIVARRYGRRPAFAPIRFMSGMVLPSVSGALRVALDSGLSGPSSARQPQAQSRESGLRTCGPNGGVKPVRVNGTPLFVVARSLQPIAQLWLIPTALPVQCIATDLSCRSAGRERRMMYHARFLDSGVVHCQRCGRILLMYMNFCSGCVGLCWDICVPMFGDPAKLGLLV